jgi:ADP-heptose:LPS heptosyltransferase
MSIFVIQLARFGDIFQTQPALNALRRRFPGVEIHLLVRERFKDAAIAACGGAVVLHTLPTAAILAPVYERSEDGLGEAGTSLNAFVGALKKYKFSKIINLSFSPFSSYLTDELADSTTQISGYTRHADGYLSIPDDSSAYFYAQAGVGKHNRYHVTEVFAAVAGVDLEEQDFSVAVPLAAKSGSIVVHLGASQAFKAYPPEMWREVLSGLQGRGAPIVLVGSAGERPMADSVCAGFSPEMVENRVGQSSMEQLVKWVGEAQLVVGADSAPVHIAALTRTPVLNLSCAGVNFWETGPYSAGSRILHAKEISQITPPEVIAEALAMINGQEGAAYALRDGLQSGYRLRTPEKEFYWPLLQALYTAADYPPLPAGASPLGFHRLFDVAELAVSQLEKIKPGQTQGLAILRSIDEMLVQLPQLDPLVEPVVNWFQTERLRMGPSGADQVLARTRQLFEQLGWIAAVYHRPENKSGLCERAVQLAALCVPAFREFEAASAMDSFQQLLTVLQDLGRHTTKVGAQDWSSVLKQLSAALENGDLIELADTLQGDLPEWIGQIQRQTETSDLDVIV